MPTANEIALSELAARAAQCVATDELLTCGDNAGVEVYAALSATEQKVLAEAAAVPADTPEALRSKALVVARLMRTALNDDSSATEAGLALLRSLISDLTREVGAA